jgi:hypothetical protein
MRGVAIHDAPSRPDARSHHGSPRLLRSLAMTKKDTHDEEPRPEGPQGRPSSNSEAVGQQKAPARSDAPEGRESEDSLRGRMAPPAPEAKQENSPTAPEGQHPQTPSESFVFASSASAHIRSLGYRPNRPARSRALARLRLAIVPSQRPSTMTLGASSLPCTRTVRDQRTARPRGRAAGAP